jgi:hypothetical protein
MPAISEFCGTMKSVINLLSALVITAVLFSSCQKEEKPYAVPEKGNAESAQVHMGEEYDKQIYFSLTNGQVASNNYKDWDIALTTGADNPELWMNGGKQVLIYPAGTDNYAAVTSKDGIANNAWLYDHPSGLSGKSGLGILKEGNHLGEVLVVDGGEGIYFKMQVLEATATTYKIKTGPLEAGVGSEITLNKDEDYNYVYYSFSSGIVRPEPPKKDWDIQFTRYRHVYYDFNPDGSDMLYILNGALTNPYKTKSGEDTTKGYDFNTFSAAEAQNFSLFPDKDIIGFDWKIADISSSPVVYTVNAKKVYVVQDQNGQLWKLHFVGFYDSNNKKGSPQFEYQKL